ncbi:thermonuclease family protein [Dethiosulfovibrio sp. F2B]|uniref:thermonuclease family protein n=1 Tax=Dethiosulfovibrio faecalis TaxID=2720018 RepID=UPI001F15E5A7|nr:thermonuclease family protein [Dethiosulfovibrio faecalis]MCF4152283.1 thermonuclease family protein [Dethiosulfovibrio faecalis]
MRGRSSLVLSLFLILSAFSSEGAILRGRVVSVLDGDTFDVMCGRRKLRVRCLLMDTPELHHPVRGIEEFGLEAMKAAESMVLGKSVILETAGVDRYERTLAHLWYRDGKEDRDRLLSEELCRLGLAQPLLMGDELTYSDRLELALEEACSEGNGFWRVARSRLFSPGQIKSELTSLRGHFVEVRLRVSRISDGPSLWRIYPSERGFSVTVRKEVFRGVLPGYLSEGAEIRVVGKVMAGYHGAEISIGSAIQISPFRHI